MLRISLVALMLGTLSFLVTTPEAWQDGQRKLQLSMLGEALLKDSVLLGASILTAADSLQAARADPGTIRNRGATQDPG